MTEPEEMNWEKWYDTHDAITGECLDSKIYISFNEELYWLVGGEWIPNSELWRWLCQLEKR